MKYIDNHNDLEIENLKFNKIFEREVSFPEKVFNDKFKYFRAYEFETIFLSDFFKGLKRYIDNINDSSFTVYSVTPTTDFFYKNLKYYGVALVTTEDTDTDYDDLLSYDPKGSGEILNIVLDELVTFSDNDSWGIFGSRSWEIGIVGFENKATLNLFLESFGEDKDMFCSLSEYIQDLDDMLHFSDKAKENYSKLLKNYSK